MPRCRSSTMVSVWVLPSSTLPISAMTPAANSSRSVRLVLPASTCARIPRLRVLTERHVPWIGRKCQLDEHERCPQLGYLLWLLGALTPSAGKYSRPQQRSEE